MKALSLTQPWPWIILHLGKRIENRSRNLGNYRGTLLLHASKGMTLRDWRSAYDFVAAHFALGLADDIPEPDSPALVRGAIVGVCEVVNQCAPGPVWLPHDGPRGVLRSIPASWDGDQERWYMGAHAYVLDQVRYGPEARVSQRKKPPPPSLSEDDGGGLTTAGGMAAAFQSVRRRMR